MKKLLVTGLFGCLDYEIDFNSSDIIIITGPNGYGKTMLLGFVDKILNNDIESMLPLKFSFLEIQLLNDVVVDITNNNDEINVRVFSGKDMLVFESNPHKNNKLEHKSYELDADKTEYFLSLIADEINSKNKTRKFKISDEIFDKYIAHYRPTFIRAERVSQYENADANIMHYSKELSKRIKKASDIASEISQSLDSTLPFRLSEKIHDRTLTQRSTNAKDRLIGVESIKKKYISYGLIEEDDGGRSAEAISPIVLREYSELWDLYVEDSIAKLDVYKELYEKINIFVSLLNEKSFAFKKINVSKDKGFYFTSDHSTDEIPLEKLSSGEQNQIALYYEMIFHSSENSIIMIDEPEISLHVAWQKEFLSSIKSIQRLNKPAKVIIATHSPNIIDNNWDITRDLFKASKESITGNEGE